MLCRYLGLYKEEIDAATAYDREAVRRRGIHAVTNFDLSEYIDLLGEPSLSLLPCALSFKGFHAAQSFCCLTMHFCLLEEQDAVEFQGCEMPACYSLSRTDVWQPVSAKKCQCNDCGDQQLSTI